MNEDANLAGPAPMEGHGEYNRKSSVQATGAVPALALLKKAAYGASLPTDDGAPVIVADYGSSQGRNSLVPMSAAIEVLRSRVGGSRPLSVVHTDLPGNDFSALFQLLDGDPASYLRGDPAVFASAVGRSFYEQVLPPASVSLGWSGWAVQWLSRTPAMILDHVQIACSRDENARAAYARQAAEDWATFLHQRSKELLPGGRLVILTMARTDDGNFGYGPLLAAMYETLCALADEGLILPEEKARMAIPTVGRTRMEFCDPFANGRIPELSLNHIEIFEGEDRIWEAFAADGNARAFGAKWAAFSSASVLPTLASSLSGGAADPRAAAFEARMETGMAQRLALSPEKMMIPLAALVLVRE
ncbi:hypothetical protein GCM10007874_25430 [Labrys miyagiensis]|uniref:SAM-dependent methyltransferase n=1 Tax=Labrys miyagiensis TaxID=346912 RepID=A0ABQ6CGQ9_9HYPH|nr:hypothetical protein [Labrys miyagiensis]GLS19526.1 hypothetical protein GCM10007874_25430 [Labrys miyagiensis]